MDRSLELKPLAEIDDRTSSNQYFEPNLNTVKEVDKQTKTNSTKLLTKRSSNICTDPFPGFEKETKAILQLLQLGIKWINFSFTTTNEMQNDGLVQEGLKHSDDGLQIFRNKYLQSLSSLRNIEFNYQILPEELKRSLPKEPIRKRLIGMVLKVLVKKMHFDDEVVVPADAFSEGKEENDADKEKKADDRITPIAASINKGNNSFNEEIAQDAQTEKSAEQWAEEYAEGILPFIFASNSPIPPMIFVEAAVLEGPAAVIPSIFSHRTYNKLLREDMEKVLAVYNVDAASRIKERFTSKAVRAEEQRNAKELFSCCLRSLGPGHKSAALLQSLSAFFDQRLREDLDVIDYMLQSRNPVCLQLFVTIMSSRDTSLSTVSKVVTGQRLATLTSSLEALHRHFVIKYLVDIYCAVKENIVEAKRVRPQLASAVLDVIVQAIEANLPEKLDDSQELAVYLLPEMKSNSTSGTGDPASAGQPTYSAAFFESGSVIQKSIGYQIQVILESEVFMTIIDECLRAPAIQLPGAGTPKLYFPLIIPLFVYAVDTVCQCAFFVVTSKVAIHYGQLGRSSRFNDYDLQGPDDWTGAELWLAVFYFSALFHELGEVLELQGDVALYLREEWNYTDILNILLGLVWFACRLDPGRFTIARVCVALAAIPQAVGLLRNFSLFPNLGRLVKALKYMLADLSAFLILYLVCIAGFGVAFRGLFAHSTEYRSNVFSFLTLFSGTLGNFDFGVYDDTSNDVVSGVGVVILVIFIVFTSIILLNMLIAMMGDSYQRAKDEWYDLKTSIVSRLALNNTRTPLSMLPPPFNLISMLLCPLEFFSIARKSFLLSSADDSSNFFKNDNIRILSWTATAVNAAVIYLPFVAFFTCVALRQLHLRYLQELPRLAGSLSKAAALLLYPLCMAVAVPVVAAFLLLAFPFIVVRTDDLHFKYNARGTLMVGKLSAKTLRVQDNSAEDIVSPAALVERYPLVFIRQHQHILHYFPSTCGKGHVCSLCGRDTEEAVDATPSANTYNSIDHGLSQSEDHEQLCGRYCCLVDACCSSNKCYTVCLQCVSRKLDFKHMDKVACHKK